MIYPNYGLEIVKVTEVEKLPGVKNCGLTAKTVLTTRPLVLPVGTAACMTRGPVSRVVAELQSPSEKPEL